MHEIFQRTNISSIIIIFHRPESMSKTGLRNSFNGKATQPFQYVYFLGSTPDFLLEHILQLLP